MKSKFIELYNNLIIEEAQKNNEVVDPATLDDQKVKKLLSYKVNCSGLKNAKEKQNKIKTDLGEDGMLMINGLRYSSIYKNIKELELFQKIYPGVDKASCKLWHVSNESSSTKAFAENENNPKWIRSIGKSINNIVKFDQTFDQNIDETIDTAANGFKEKSKGVSKKDLETSSIESMFLIFYVDDSGTILKPTSLNDDQYKKLCESLASIAIGIKSGNGDNQGLDTLKSTSGQTLQSIGQNIIKTKAKAKAEEEASIKSKFKSFLKESFNLYKTVCKQSFSDFTISVQTKPWGKDTLNKLIEIGNQQVEKGEANIQFPDIEFVFGHKISSGSQMKKQTTV